MERHDEFEQKRRIWRQQDFEEMMEKHDLLSILDMDSENWLTPDNIETKLDSQVETIMPGIVNSHADYYKKIELQSHYMQMGDYEEAEKVRIDYYNNKYKNKLLLPVFRELKTVIRNILPRKQAELGELYDSIMGRVANEYPVHSAKRLKIKEKVDEQFKSALADLELREDFPSVQLRKYEEQIKSRFLSRYGVTPYSLGQVHFHSLHDWRGAFSLLFQGREQKRGH